MRLHARVSFLALICGVLLAALAPAAAQAAEAPAIEKFVAVNCEEEECAQTETSINLGPPFGEQHYIEPKEPSAKEAEEEGFLQAGGRVPFGVTDFKVATEGSLPKQVPTSKVEHLRTDVAPGLATNPLAVEHCGGKEFGETEIAPGVPFFVEPTCSPKTIVGQQFATVYVEALGIDLALKGIVYNLEPTEGLSSLYGVALEIPKALTEALLKSPTPQLYAHTLIEGNVEWGKQARGTNQGDYHDYFEIHVSPSLPLVASRLTFEGRNGEGDFVTNATSCPGHNTTTLKLTDVEKTTVKSEYTTPVGLMGCNGETDKLGTKFERLLFEPTFALASGSTLSDQPNEVTAEVEEKHNPKANDPSQVKTASITLPEGMTLNPSAAHGLEACTPAQARIHSEEFGVACPEGSAVGTVALDVPGLPPGSLTGNAYLGGPESGPITDPPYIMYIVANSKRFGISVRLKAEVMPNATTGQVTTVLNENPEQPFRNLTVKFNRGVLTPIANPLVCGSPTGTTSFTPVTGTPAHEGSFGVSVTGCASSPPPFAPTQTTGNQNGNGGGNTSFTVNLFREDGQQYLSKVSTTLPPGLAGAIPNATQCPEPGASKGECPATSQIGVAAALAGAGPTPFAFSGPVYLTGPYNGAPFGLSVAIPAIAGPFSLGTVVTRATINIDPHSARVTVSSTLPRIVKGVPMRLRQITVSINKQGFLLNPTSCSPLATDSTVSGFTPGSSTEATASLSTPFQLANCGALGFTPKFVAKTSAQHSKTNGASIETTLNYTPGNANVKSVLVQLPKQLPSRLTTLQKACLAATFEVNPFACPSGSFVGGARANTPLLPGKLTGPAILVSHAGAAFPDLDLVLEANGVRIILVGNTDIKKGITTTNFATTPDSPVSSATVNLPLGSHSALATEKLNTNLCTAKLVMPTTITAQNGKQFKQNTVIQPTGCGVQIIGHKVSGNMAVLTVKTFSAGRISGSGSGLSTVARHLKGANGKATLKVPLSSGGRNRRPFTTKVRVGFVPKKKGPSSVAFVKVRFG